MPTTLFTIGDRVITTAPIDYLPYTLVDAHETGTVDDVDSMGLTIRWDKHHAGLVLYQNCTLLVEPEASSVSVMVRDIAA